MDIQALIRKHKLIKLCRRNKKDLTDKEQILVNLFPDVKDVVLKIDSENRIYYLYNNHLLFVLDNKTVYLNVDSRCKESVYLNEEYKKIDYQDICIWIAYYLDINQNFDFDFDDNKLAIPKYVSYYFHISNILTYDY